MINGIINVYKEKGFTSHDVVAKLRGILRQKKIGHTGTLDPDAVGVLPVCLGSGTKLCDMLTDKSKEYEAVMLLGVRTDTEDITGQVLENKDVNVSKEQIVSITDSFVGTYDQIPPMYSAIKVNGKKLYELARKGQVVERKARPVTIESIDIIEISLPRVRFRVSCSKGTYIRSLCRDIGDMAGCGACMESLIRTRVGTFRLEDACTLAQISGLVQNGEINKIVTPVDACFAEYQEITVSGKNIALVRNGNMFYAGSMGTVKQNGAHNNGADKIGEASKSRQFRVYTDGEDGKVFAGIYAYDDRLRAYRPVKMFLNGE